jgi:hypothetical protein
MNVGMYRRKVANGIRSIPRLLKPGVIAIHAVDPDNIGDMTCSPLDYFQFECPSYRYNFWNLCLGDTLYPKSAPVILGGGGLFHKGEVIDHFAQSHKGMVVGWGLGKNRYREQVIPDYQGASNFALLGIRDWPSPYNWVPCVSCMSRCFDNYHDAEPKHDFVVYEHRNRPLFISDAPLMKNNASSLEDVIQFLCSGETVVTNSYHGVYWAQLLGRKVVAIPFSNRFEGFRFPPILVERESWREGVKLAKEPDTDFLSLCRHANLEFATRVSDLFGYKIMKRP